MAETTCPVEGCERPLSRDALCEYHRQYRRTYGRLPAYVIHKDERTRVLTKIDRQAECWLWTGSKTRDGYGRVRFRGDTRQAHRVVYTLLRGEIPDGMELDHLCFVTSCVNPDHLEPVPAKVNRERVRPHKRPWMRDMPQNQPGYLRKTGAGVAPTCKRGHPFTLENTKPCASRPGRRQCRECLRIGQRERRIQRRSA